MPHLPLRAPSALEHGLARTREEFDVPVGFPAEVSQAAGVATPALDGRADRTDIPLIAIDPPGARDLDQAFHGWANESGFRVWYAIADAAAFVGPDDPVGAVPRRNRRPLRPCHRSAQATGRSVRQRDRAGRVKRTHPSRMGAGAARTTPRQHGACQQKQAAVDRVAIDLAEAVVLADHVFEHFDGHVVDLRGDQAVVQLDSHAIVAEVEAVDGHRWALAQSVTLRLVEADPVLRTLQFVPADARTVS